MTKIVHVRNIRRIPTPDVVCDLTVDGNHNLFIRDEGSSDHVLVHNCQAAEFNLDENRMLRPLIGLTKGEMWSAERLCVEYGMNHYSHSIVKKADRSRLEQLPLKHVAEYGALDVALPLRVMRMQRALAKYRNDHLPNRPYAKFDKYVMEAEAAKLQQFCFHPETYIATERGPMLMSDVVHAIDQKPRVWSYNHDSEQIELDDVTATSEHETPEDMVRLHYPGGSVCVTESHELWCENRKCYVRASDVTPDDDLLLCDLLELSHVVTTIS